MLVRVALGRRNLKISPRNGFKNANCCAGFIGRATATATALPFSTSTHTGDPYSCDDERFLMHSLVKSLLQVFSISVHTFGLDKEKACNIYGCVRVTQGQGSSFTLYDRDPANPQTIHEQGNLSLIGPSSTHVSGTAPTSIDFFLKDKTRDITIVNTRHDLDFEMDSYDKLRKDIIQGDHGFVSMSYVPWRFAVLATVEVVAILQKKFDTSNPFSQVYGTVFAGYANIKRSLKDDDGLENMRSVLLSKSSDEAVQATVAEPLCLSINVVAVPRYASLDIQVELWDSHGQFASGSVEFTTHYWSHYDTKTIRGDGGVVEVNVKYHDAFSDNYKRNVGNYIQSFAGMKGKSESKRISDSPNNFPMASGGQLPSSVTALRGSYSSATLALNEYSGNPMVEIFSIFVSGFTHEVSAICGKIEAYDDCYERLIYERNFNNPELFSADRRRIITLEGPCDVDDCYFDLFLNLKDPVSDLEICNGWIPWGPPNYGACIPFRDTRLCSVVQGQNGCAAVYYTIFRSAFRAYLEIKVISKDTETVSGNICGRVLACYSTHNYLSIRDKQFYKSIIFDKPQLDAVELTTESNIPLSKFSVAVPCDSSLIIEADLRLKSIDNKNHGVVSGTLEFEADLSDKILKEIRGEHYCLLVSVKFFDRIWSCSF